VDFSPSKVSTTIQDCKARLITGLDQSFTVCLQSESLKKVFLWSASALSFFSLKCWLVEMLRREHVNEGKLSFKTFNSPGYSSIFWKISCARIKRSSGSSLIGWWCIWLLPPRNQRCLAKSDLPQVQTTFTAQFILPAELRSHHHFISTAAAILECTWCLLLCPLPWAISRWLVKNRIMEIIDPAQSTKQLRLLNQLPGSVQTTTVLLHCQNLWLH